VSRDPADGENRRSPQVGDELVDGSDERSVGFGLPLADADVEGVLVVAEDVDASWWAAAVGVVPGPRVSERLTQVMKFRDVVGGLPQRESC
jgi:hypothetical protein